MQLTPMVQNRNTNFKGASSISKYSDDVQKVITQSIDSAFENVLLKTAEELGNKKQSRLAKYITDAEAYKAIKKHTDKVEEKITSGIAWTIGKTANTELSKKIVIGLSHFKKISARMADLASIAITFFYVNNTRKSKKIEEERKMPLMVNNIAITVVSSTMAALIDKGSDIVLDRVKGALCLQKGKQVLDNVIEKVPNIEKELNGRNIQEFADDILKSKEFRTKIKDYTKRFEKAKSLTIFAFTVRFLVTVLMVPVAGKIVKMIKEKSQNIPKDNTQKSSTPAEQKPVETKDDDTKAKEVNAKAEKDDDDDDDKDDD